MAGKTANNYYKQNQVSLQINENGFLPPQALDLEEAVLGALLLEKEAVIEVLDLLQPESFYKEAHQLIFKAIVDLSNSFQGIDILTVAEQLKRNGTLEGAGGAVFLAQLSSRVHSAVHVEFHARIVAQKYIQRQLIRASTEIQEKAYDPNTDVDDLLDFSEKKLFDIGQGNIKKDAAKIEDIIRMSVKNMEEAGKREDGLSGVPCGFSEL
ncbi:MAG TPA: replicative DNA helicase, partial [Bacteroidales bacterium]|nr:replicative DNA helicase [Bacteroidales bacterium]